MINNLLSFADGLKSIGGVLLAVVILLVMVTVHEFGHYVVGKLLGFKINEFSIGFGPALFQKRSKKTGELFAVRLIPLGGYCAFDGEDEGDEEEPPRQESFEQPFEELQDFSEKDVGRVEITEKSEENPPEENPKNTDEEYPEPQGEKFNDQAPWKRILVLLAGAAMNYLLALFLIVVMFACIGRPVYQLKRGEPDVAQTTATQTQSGDVEGFVWQTGDVILELDGKTPYMITDYIDILEGKKAGEQVPMLILREGKMQTVQMTMAEDGTFTNMSDVQKLLRVMGFVKGDALYTVSHKDGFWETIGNSFSYSFKIGGTILRSLGELLTGKIGIDSMGGPVTTITVTAQAASSGISSFLSIAAFIGVNLAVFNLLPIPALDGCKVIFCIIEWIRKKPVNRKVEAIIHFVGIILLFGFAILVDLLQLFKI